MNNWQMASVYVTLQTALRCGDRPLGFVARCLPFVPGHIPLMAMVPTLVRLLGLSDNWDAYQQVQDFVETHIRFTPFFISPPDEKKKFLIPEGDGKITAKLERDYLVSYHGVGIDYGTRGAKEGCLFETEAISPRSRQGAPTRMIGGMFWKPGVNSKIQISDDGKINKRFNFTDILVSSQWGGERSKGYGCLKNVETENAPDVFGAAVNLKGESPVLIWPAHKPAPVYLQYDEDIAKKYKISGVLKPVVGRVFDKNNGAGQTSVLYGGNILWDVGWRTKASMNLRLEAHTAVAVLED